MSENSLAVSKKVFQYTPLLCIKDNEKLKPVSSGLFLKYKEYFFLVTAGHTIEQYGDKGLGVISNRKFLTIGGIKGISSPERLDNDRIDIGIYLLSQEFLNQLSGECEFFDLRNMDIDHDDSPENFAYLVVGHPLTRVTFNDFSRKVLLRPFLFLTGSIQRANVFTSLEIQIKTHLVIGYDKNKIMQLPTKNKGKGPNPLGLSGCGVWRISNTIVHDVELVKYFPTGIIIEYSGKEKVFVVTRLRLITEALRMLFKINLQKSRRVSIK